MMDISFVKIGNIAEVTKLAGFEFTKYIEYREDGEIIALRALNLRNGELDLADIKRISRDVSDKLTRSKLYQNEILLTYTGNGYGDCALIEENDKFHLAPNICKITPDESKVDPYYLYSIIRDRSFRELMKNYIGGSSQPTIPMKTIRLLEIPLPNLPTQAKIGRLIHEMDKKQRNNKKINENLLQQALCLFEDEFVTKADIDEELPLYNFADYINGAAFKPDELGDAGLPVIKIAELKAGITGSTRFFSGDKGPKYLVHNKDILFSWSGNPETSIDLFIWSEGNGILNQHTFNVKSKYECPWFTFLMLKYHKPTFTHIASNKQTTGLGHVTAADLKRLTFPFDLDRMNAFETTVRPIMDLLYGNLLENRELSSLRDTLLPRLMSGELDVSDIDL